MPRRNSSRRTRNILGAKETKIDKSIHCCFKVSSHCTRREHRDALRFQTIAHFSPWTISVSSRDRLQTSTGHRSNSLEYSHPCISDGLWEARWIWSSRYRIEGHNRSAVHCRHWVSSRRFSRVAGEKREDEFHRVYLRRRWPETGRDTFDSIPSNPCVVEWWRVRVFSWSDIETKWIDNSHV